MEPEKISFGIFFETTVRVDLWLIGLRPLIVGGDWAEFGTSDSGMLSDCLYALLTGHGKANGITIAMMPNRKTISDARFGIRYICSVFSVKYYMFSLIKRSSSSA